MLPSPADPARPRIAVVEDNDGCRKALVRLLTASGLEPLGYASAEEYLADARVHDCVVLDVNLPGLSGLDLEFHLRESDPSLGVVFVSATSDASRDEIARRTGRSCLRKPVDETTLLVAIARAILPNR